MDNYNFDIKQLLDTFDGDPEKLANAFADALNAELAAQRNINHIDEAANDVADAWQDFVDEYFEVHELPKGTTEEDYYVETESVKMLMDLIVRAAPYMTLFQEYLMKLQDMNDKAVHKVVDTAQKAEDEFSTVMSKFFKEHNL